jgi:hypothetical protein
MRRQTLLPLLLLTAGATSSTAGIDQLAWLKGCWERRSARGAVIQEQWMAPRGGVMMGMSRTVLQNALREYEFLMIREVDGKLRYEAQPSGQPAATFPQKILTDTLVEFEDPAHDFPQRIGYRKVGSDSVIAWIDGTTAQGPRKIEFPYARAECGA